MSRTRYVWFAGLIGLLAPFARADVSSALNEAAKPLMEGVPEVAVVRLEVLLNKSSTLEEWRAVAKKLAEAQVASDRPQDAIRFLSDSRLRDLPWANFWTAQAFAKVGRWADALPLYEKLAGDDRSPFRQPAIFGAAEMLRALGRRDEALARFATLFHDKDWATQAQFRSVELYVDKADAVNGRRVLDEAQAKSVEDRKQRRLLRGRLELILQRPERAIDMFQAGNAVVGDRQPALFESRMDERGAE